MATSGTTSFDLDIEEIIQEAYERCGLGGSFSGYQLRGARRSLNILFSEWGNRGVHLWKVKLASIPLVLGQAQYNYANDPTNFPNPNTTGINDVLEAYVRNNSDTANPVDISLTKIDRSAYAAIPNNLSQGTPSQYYVDRVNPPSIFLYQTPGSGYSGASYLLRFYYLARIEDAGNYINNSDVVFRFIPAMVSGLAYYLSIKFSPQKTEQLRMLYEDELQRALTEDGQRTSLYISPQTFYGDGV